MPELTYFGIHLNMPTYKALISSFWAQTKHKKLLSIIFSLITDGTGTKPEKIDRITGENIEHLV